MTRTNALTIDVEDYFQVSAFEREISRNDWPQYESRVVANTERILRLLAERDVHATFFLLGWIAERRPELVRSIAAAGHEVASHGYWHHLVYQQTPDEFRQDIVAARDVLESLTGQRVTSYRAPSFSVVAASLWALEILVEEGFEIDASIAPVRHDRYGLPDAPARPHRRDTPAGPIWEFPMSVCRVAGRHVPVSGGGYFRLLPYAWTQRGLLRINERDGLPFVFYLHPWEVDPQQPRLPIRSRISRFRHYVNLHTTAAKLERLLEAFRFDRLDRVMAAWRTSVDETAWCGEPQGGRAE